MHLNLRKQQPKIIIHIIQITYMYILLYIKFMVATKQKPIIETCTRERNPNVILKIVIKSQGKRRKIKTRKNLNDKKYISINNYI